MLPRSRTFFVLLKVLFLFFQGCTFDHGMSDAVPTTEAEGLPCVEIKAPLPETSLEIQNLESFSPEWEQFQIDLYLGTPEDEVEEVYDLVLLVDLGVELPWDATFKLSLEGSFLAESGGYEAGLKLEDDRQAIQLHFLDTDCTPRTGEGLAATIYLEVPAGTIDPTSINVDGGHIMIDNVDALEVEIFGLDHGF